MTGWSAALDTAHLRECAMRVNDLYPGCSVYLSSNLSQHGPLKRGRYAGWHRFDHVSLRSRFGTRRPNPGTGGYNDAYEGELAASWTEWGWFLALVFDLDPHARMGGYADRDDFHAQTDGRFVDPRNARERQVIRATKVVSR